MGKHKLRTPQNKKHILMAIAAMIIGIIVVVYPVVVTLISNYSQEQVAIKTRENVKQQYTEDQRQTLIEQARDYNSQLHSGPILDPFLERVAPDTKMYQDYLTYLDFDGVIGSIRIPAINVNLPIYHGTEDDTLNKGAGHLFGTALPVGGNNTHTVITAHSGLGSATMFDDLPKLKKGDSIYFEVGGEKLRYVIYDTEVVKPTETDSLQPIANKDIATLITCTPYGINTHRLLVHAERAELEPEAEAELEAPVAFKIWRGWMWLSLALVAIALGLLFAPKRKKKTEETTQDTQSLLNV